MTHLTLALTLALGAAPEATDAHAERNPLYAELREGGVPDGQGKSVPLPPPTMQDGLDAAAQRAVITEVAGRAYDPDQLLRRSVVSPYVLRIGDAKPRTVDFWFVAYGDLDAIASEQFLEQLSDDGDAWTELKPADLAKRDIVIPADREDREAFGHIRFDFLDRVRIEAVTHTAWSRTDESLVVAMRLDPRFRGDAEFPNQWRPLRRGQTAGDPIPYDSAGYFMKLTRLAEPQGALFAEVHVVYVEPEGWFDGANLLRSKLPPIVQNEVRSLRREFEKAGR